MAALAGKPPFWKPETLEAPAHPAPAVMGPAQSLKPVQTLGYSRRHGAGRSACAPFCPADRLWPIQACVAPPARRRRDITRDGAIQKRRPSGASKTGISHSAEWGYACFVWRLSAAVAQKTFFILRFCCALRFTLGSIKQTERIGCLQCGRRSFAETKNNRNEDKEKRVEAW